MQMLPEHPLQIGSFFSLQLPPVCTISRFTSFSPGICIVQVQSIDENILYMTNTLVSAPAGGKPSSDTTASAPLQTFCNKNPCWVSTFIQVCFESLGEGALVSVLWSKFCGSYSSKIEHSLDNLHEEANRSKCRYIARSSGQQNQPNNLCVFVYMACPQRLIDHVDCVTKCFPQLLFLLIPQQSFHSPVFIIELLVFSL